MAFEKERMITDLFFEKNKPVEKEIVEARKDEASVKDVNDTYVYPGAGYDYKVEPTDRKMRQFPRDYDILDQVRVNAENIVERTTMGCMFQEMFDSIKKWIKMLSIAVFTFITSVLLFINGMYLFGAVALIMAFYYYGQYDIWIDRSQMHKQFAAIIPH